MSGRSDVGDEWISWAGAAELIGISVQRIEWWKRKGRIEHRAHDGVRATLRRSSVLVLGEWLQERDRGRQRAATARERRHQEVAPPAGWLSTREVAIRLGVTARTAARYARSLDGVQRGRRVWFSPEAVAELEARRREAAAQRAEEAKEWTTLRAAAGLIGCHQATVLAYVKRGLIEHRDVTSPRPSLSRASVEAFAVRWKTTNAKSGRRARVH